MPRFSLPPRLAAAAGRLLLGLLADLAALAAGRRPPPRDDR
ncbi:hypothetical protein [Alienimonas chondri]|uniref:Uncharacterized protein n=1 Tax=Alienimonas chondri TaxID=2681879 RepID=A0ABX1VHY2_9PLAN|nr:hypothetical protein [Alienimonas chondri]NNJ27729.1 hypothetical protein [Alienimonas chondri]